MRMTSGLLVARSSIEVRTIQKVRIRILPLVFLLYVIAFLDRVNIGFAALTMNKELGITNQQFGLLAGISDFEFYFWMFNRPGIERRT
jgi:ACS family tartrate transporter-like MFS transporter